MFRNILKCTICKDKKKFTCGGIDIPCPLCMHITNNNNIVLVEDYEIIDEEIDYNIDDFVVDDYEKDLEKAIKLSLQNTKNCIICFDNKINAVFVPCGHLCCCYSCAAKCKKKCPICRKKNKLIQKIYSID